MRDRATRAWVWAQDHATPLGRAALAIVVVGAALIRLATFTVGLPYSSYVDETYVLDPAATQIAGGTWDPGIYWYPSFVISLISLTARVMSLLGANGVSSGARTTVASPYVEVVEPQALLIAGRLVVVACSVGIVWVVGCLGNRLGGRRVGLSAAALAAVLPAFVRRGSVVIIDTPGAFFTVLTLAIAARLSTEVRVRRWAVVGGIAAGLSMTSKYTAAFVGVSLVVVLLMRTDLALVERAKALALTVGAALAAAVVTMPALVLRTSTVVDDMQAQYRSYTRRASPDTYWDQILLRREVGWVVLVPAVVGLVFLVQDRRTRPVTIGFLTFAILTMAALLRSDYQPFRNMLQVLPFLCVSAAVGVVEVVRVVGSRLRLPRPVGVVASLAVMALLVGFVAIVGAGPYVRYERGRHDTRLAAGAWLEQHVRPGDDVLVAAELGFLPRELDRIPGRVVVRRQLGGASGEGIEWVVAGVLPETPLAWSLPRAGREKVASFGSMYMSCTPGDRSGIRHAYTLCPASPVPRTWHDNRVNVVIYGPAGS